MRITLLIGTALLSTATYHTAYAEFLHKVFAYADFRYENSTLAYMLWTYIIATSPIVFSKNTKSPSAIGSVLIYGLSYIPIQLTLTFVWTEKNLELFFAQTALAISMSLLFLSNKIKHVENHFENNNNTFFKGNYITKTINSITIIGLIIIVYEHRDVLRFVSFEDVYILRSEANELGSSIITQYLILWISYCFIPFYISRSICLKKKSDLIVGIAAALIIYGSTGSKIALMTPIFIYAMNFIYATDKDFAIRFLLITSTFVLAILVAVPEEGVLRHINSLFLLRVYGSNGWVASVYYEYFPNNGLTFYNHIGPINYIFGGYPYGEKSLGNVISNFYFPDIEANFSAGFWASDGFAALGAAGVMVITLILCSWMRILDKATKNYNKRFINLWLLGFWMGIMNAPFFTVLLSGGGILTLILFQLGNLKIKKSKTKCMTSDIKNNHTNALGTYL